MKDVYGVIEYKGKEYKYVFNLNVMEAIQDEYETLDKWGELTDGKNGEPNAKAVNFGFTEMFNEALEMECDETGKEFKPFTKKQVGRMLTEYGLFNATKQLNQTIAESVKSEEKN